MQVEGFPIGGIVPYEGELYTIVSRYGDALSCFYGLRQRVPAGPPKTHASVPGERLLEEIAAYAKFNVGDRVCIDHRTTTFPIKRRHWNFRRGEVMYGLTDVNKQLLFVNKTQQHLLAVARAHERVLGTPHEQTLPGYWDLDPAL